MFASSPMSVIEGVDCNLSEFFRFAMFRVHVFFCSLRNARRAPHKNIWSLQFCYHDGISIPVYHSHFCSLRNGNTAPQKKSADFTFLLFGYRA